VNPAYKSAPSMTGKNFDDLSNLADKDGWPGHFCAP
jgi:hypothetical protein